MLNEKRVISYTLIIDYENQYVDQHIVTFISRTSTTMIIINIRSSERFAGAACTLRRSCL